MHPQLMPVSFHGDTVMLVGQDNEPFVAMRPVVTNIGLDWASQYTKLNTASERWGVVIITTPSLGGAQEAVCLPLRKLASWLMTINPNKVKPELRDKIIRYQEECDDALWDYWTKGSASRPGNNNVNQQIALSRHRVALLEKLLKTRDNTLRGALHEQLAMVSKHLGLSVPALEDIGKGTEPVPNVVYHFWAALEQLDGLGERYNHAGSMSGSIALNYPHLMQLFKKHRIPLSFTPELRRALTVSQQPRFIEHKGKYSLIEYKTVRCWIFEGPIRP